ncbi:hypothetical protein [Streptomyces hokutonensis]|uniref:hypothetical protein n=1 Tax=Streptomyces hokutonensis TaxID=1306990 RepID=UPI000374CB3F|nr:hypothetical protein [Streptomyces hokutonensis]
MPKLCEPVVSIQRADVFDPVEGHLAWGVLMDRDLVAVPGPLEWLRDETIPLQVLLASSGGGTPGVVERIRLESARIVGLDTHTEGAVALVRLSQPALHRPVREAFDKRAFEARLAADPDVWTALEETRGVPPGIRELPLDGVLGPVRDWEIELRRALVQDDSRPTPGEIGTLWCSISPWCDCPGPWW